MEGCGSNSSVESFPEGFVPTSRVTSYDGPSVSNIGAVAGRSLNAVIDKIDDRLGSISSSLASHTHPTSGVASYDGTPTFSSFSPTGDLNNIINQIGTWLDDLATSDVAYDGGGASNYTPTAATALGHLAGIDTELGSVKGDITSLNSSLSAKADLTDLYAHIDVVSNSFVISGSSLTGTGAATFSGKINAGDYLVDGKKFSTVSSSAITLQASKDNYIDIDSNGNITVTGVPIGDPTPSVSGMILYMVTTDGSGATAISDLRNLYPFNGGLIADGSIETRHIKDGEVTTAKLSNSGAVAGSYAFSTTTVDAKGRTTSVSSPVAFSGLTDDDLMQYDTLSGKWVNVPVYGTVIPTLTDTHIYTYDSGTGKATGVSRDALFSERWVPYEVEYTDFQPNATATGSHVIDSAPAGSVITGVKYKHSTAFSGGSISSANVQVKDSAGNAYTGASPFDVFQAVGNKVGEVVIPGSSVILDHVSSEDLSLELNVGGDVIDNLTAGVVKVWIKIDTVNH